MKKQFLAMALLAWTVAGVSAMRAQDAAPAAPAPEWVSLFDGKTLNGWKPEERPGSFKVEDGNLVVDGERGHLYYVGDGQPFENFEFEAQVRTNPNANSGIFIHTRPQPEGWPAYGYECQVNNTHGDPIKTGSIYNVVDVYKVNPKEGEPFAPGVRVNGERVMLTVAKSPANDNEWFTYNIRVQGKRVTTRVNGVTLVDFSEPESRSNREGLTQKLGSGTFAIQAHDPKSRILYRNIRVRRLP